MGVPASYVQVPRVFIEKHAHPLTGAVDMSTDMLLNLAEVALVESGQDSPVLSQYIDPTLGMALHNQRANNLYSIRNHPEHVLQHPVSRVFGDRVVELSTNPQELRN